MLDGIFAFVIADENGIVMAARDHVGIKPLYMASNSKTGQVWCVTSTQNSINPQMQSILKAVTSRARGDPPHSVALLTLAEHKLKMVLCCFLL